MASLLTRRKEIFFREKDVSSGGSAYNYNSGVESYTYALEVEDDLAVTTSVESFARRKASVNAGVNIPSKGNRVANVTFSMEARSSGTAGTPPKIGPVLRCCGHTQVIASGSALVGGFNPFPQNSNQANSPTSGGTFSGTKSGEMRVEITAISVDTSITFNVMFVPGDKSGGTPYSAQVQNSGTAVTLSGGALNGVTIDFGDPSSLTAGYAVGDRWSAPLVSSSQADVSYLPEGRSTYLADMYIEHDGQNYKIKNAAGSFTIESEGNGRMMFRFTFSGVLEDYDHTQSITGATPVDSGVPALFQDLNTLTFDADAIACASRFSFNSGIVVSPQQCATSVQGIRNYEISQSDPTFSFDPAAEAFESNATRYAGANWFTEMQTFGAKEIVMQTGGASGSIFRIEIFNFAVTTAAAGDREGLLTTDVEGVCAKPDTSDPDNSFYTYQLIFK